MKAIALLCGLLPWMAGAQGAPPRGAGASALDAPERGRLLGGAPLDDPNVAVHIVEKKQFKDEGRSELVLYPVVSQINGKYTQHFGTAASYLFHLQENFALQLTPIFNWSARSSSFDRELNAGVAQQGSPSASLLLKYGALLGVEVAPLYGKFAIYDGVLAHFSVVLSGGAGVASTAHELKVGTASAPATYGDTGYKYLFGIGGGVRVQLAERFTLRLEVRDLVSSARVDRVNGCSAGDLESLSAQRALGAPLSQAVVSAGCRVKDFTGTVGKGGYDRANDLVPAGELVGSPSSDVLNNVGFYAGVGVVF